MSGAIFHITLNYFYLIEKKFYQINQQKSHSDFTLDISTFPRIPWVIPEIQRTQVGILRAVQVESIHCAFLKKQRFVSSIPMRYGNISK